MKIFGYIFGSLIIIFVIGSYYIGTVGPETYVYLGRQVPKKFKDEIKVLGLLNNDEEIKYFYSDGLTDIKDGFYFLTDRKLVVYSNEWEEPATIVEFQEIIKLDIVYDDSFIEDSYISLETVDGLELGFPVSSEKNRDKVFFEYLLHKSNINSNIDDFEEGLDNRKLVLDEDTIQH